MFSYPPCLWILARDNLVSDGSGSISTMCVQSGVWTGKKQHIIISGAAADAVRRSGGPRVAGHRHLRILIGLEHHLKLWGRFSKAAIGLGATGTSTATPPPYDGCHNCPD
jgi:hypothetical protein